MIIATARAHTAILLFITSSGESDFVLRNLRPARGEVHCAFAQPTRKQSRLAHIFGPLGHPETSTFSFSRSAEDEPR
jgi:hypothetical protein